MFLSDVNYTKSEAIYVLGGNGILIENQLIKLMMDIESIHTYEGSYDINMLVTGRELTGISAIR